MATRIPLVLLFMATGNVWAILGLQCLIASSTALFMPSRQAIIPELVRPEQIHLANSVNGGVLAIVHILGPITGATIFAMTGTLKWIVLIDAFTYLGSAFLLFQLSYKPAARLKSAASSLVRDITDGLRYVKGEKDFFYLFILLLSADSAIGLLLPLMRPFIDEALHGTDANYGHLLGAFGLGGIVGPVIGYWAGRRFGLGRTLTINFVMEGLLIVVWSRVTNIYLSAAILFVWGINVFILIPCYMSYVHSYAKKEFMGRTFSLFDQTTYGAQILGALVVVVVGNALPTQNLLTAAGIGYLLVIAATVRSPGARLMRSRRGQAPAAESHSAAPRMEDLAGAPASGEAVETALPSEEEA